jgi:hypothetical protein
MIKRVNFTGRRRIPRAKVDIEVYDGTPRSFDATINLEELQLLPEAAVFLEATSRGSTVIKRFAFGEVGCIRPPEDRSLTEVEGENIFFTLKVVNLTDRRLLGIAEHIRPQRAGKQTAAGRRGILPVEPAELGQELWRLQFGEQDVFLLVLCGVVRYVAAARLLVDSASLPQTGTTKRMVSEPGYATSGWCAGAIRPKLLRRVGPTRAMPLEFRRPLSKFGVPLTSLAVLL